MPALQPYEEAYRALDAIYADETQKQFDSGQLNVKSKVRIVPNDISSPTPSTSPLAVFVEGEDMLKGGAIRVVARRDYKTDCN